MIKMGLTALLLLSATAAKAVTFSETIDIGEVVTEDAPIVGVFDLSEHIPERHELTSLRIIASLEDDADDPINFLRTFTTGYSGPTRRTRSYRCGFSRCSDSYDEYKRFSYDYYEFELETASLSSGDETTGRGSIYLGSSSEFVSFGFDSVIRDGSNWITSYVTDTRSITYSYGLTASLLLNVGEENLAAMTQTASGLLYQDFSVGSGPAAQSGDFVRVRYTGWLKDGTQFDSGTFGFDLDRGQAIAGWDEGIQGMQVGGSRRLIIPPELGYGVHGERQRSHPRQRHPGLRHGATEHQLASWPPDEFR